MRRLAALLALTSLLALPSCFMGRFVKNEPLSMLAMEQLEPGTTTAAQAVDLLGAPVDVVQLGKRSAYAYAYTQEKNTGIILIVVGVFNEDVRQDRAWLFFDENDVLTHAAASFEGNHTRYAMPWYDIHDPDAHRNYNEDRREQEVRHAQRMAEQNEKK